MFPPSEPECDISFVGKHILLLTSTFFYQLTSTDQIVITKLVSAVDAATKFLHWLLSPAIS